MSLLSKLLLGFSSFMLLASFCWAVQTCESQVFSNGKTYRSCSDLSVLDSYIHFSHVAETGELDVAYRHGNIEPSSWVAWAINPKSKGMVGAQALVAYHNSTSGLVSAYTSPITSYGTMLREGPLTFDVKHISAEYSNRDITIYATLVLPPNTTEINHLWQDGPVEGGRLGMHTMGGDHFKAMGALDLLSGRVTASTGGPDEYVMRVKRAHGIINALSWGFLMPLGGLAARYMKTYERLDPLWFYTHVVCQTLGYFLGLFGGLGTAIMMWRATGGARVSTPHSVIGVVLFVLGFLQILALKARPDKEHRFRRYWNWYHHTVGYVVIALSVYNIYKGLTILRPANTWRIAYTVAIGFVGLVAVVMEMVQFEQQWGWIWCRDEPSASTEADPVIVHQV